MLFTNIVTKEKSQNSQIAYCTVQRGKQEYIFREINSLVTYLTVAT